MVKYKESKKWSSSYFKPGEASSSDNEDSIVLDDPSLIQNSNLFSHMLDLENSNRKILSKFVADTTKVHQSPRTPNKGNKGASRSYFGRKIEQRSPFQLNTDLSRNGLGQLIPLSHKTKATGPISYDSRPASRQSSSNMHPFRQTYAEKNRLEIMPIVRVTKAETNSSSENTL